MSGFSGATEGGVLHGYDVVNNLSSTATDKPLSANMGKELNDSITNVSLFKMVRKITTSTSGTVNFTITGRGAGLLFITQNGLESSIYELHTTDNNGTPIVSNIAGRNVSITISGTTLSIPLPTWSSVVALYAEGNIS